MAQSKELMALRLRLTRRGYTDVSIEVYGNGAYMVKAIEPLGGMGVQTLVNPDEVNQVARW